MSVEKTAWVSCSLLCQQCRPPQYVANSLWLVSKWNYCTMTQDSERILHVFRRVFLYHPLLSFLISSKWIIWHDWCLAKCNGGLWNFISSLHNDLWVCFYISRLFRVVMLNPVWTPSVDELRMSFNTNSRGKYHQLFHIPNIGKYYFKILLFQSRFKMLLLVQTGMNPTNFKMKLRCICWLLSIITMRVQDLPGYVRPEKLTMTALWMTLPRDSNGNETWNPASHRSPVTPVPVARLAALQSNFQWSHSRTCDREGLQGSWCSPDPLLSLALTWWRICWGGRAGGGGMVTSFLRCREHLR